MQVGTPSLTDRSADTSIFSQAASGAITALAITLAFIAPLQAQQAPVLPSGGNVANGNATISQPNASTLNINQSSPQAIINWNSFSVGQGGTVNFNQPSAASATLNRVVGSTPSWIAGTINAPGTVLLVNPNGIAITKTGVINVGSFAASTLNIKDSDFLAGRYNFTGNGSSKPVYNSGTIKVSDGGFAALLGGSVSNRGVITARLGKVGLGAGEMATIDLAGDGFLSVAVPSSHLGYLVDSRGRSLVRNKGTINADGGVVYLSAATAADVLRNAVNVPGTINARTVDQRDGKIVLSGGTGGNVKVSGTLNATGASGQKGGRIDLTGANIALLNAKIDASGGAGGGAIRIGGDYQGTGTLARSQTVTVDVASMISANATEQGDGGKIIVWSDGKTSVHGILTARGAGSGKGGLIETSGHILEIAGIRVSAGPGGLWLLDPVNLTIDAAAYAAINFALNDSGGTDVTLLTTATGSSGPGTVGGTDGDIIFTNEGTVVWNTGARFTASAYRQITFNTGAQITHTGPGGALVLRADNTGTGTGTVQFSDPGQVSFAGAGGTVSIYYNPTGDSTTVNAVKYAAGSRTDYNTFVSVSGGATLTAYMLVNTLTDLQNVQNFTNTASSTYALGRNIDATGSATMNSGDSFAPLPTLFGIFDGQGYTISNLVIDKPGQSNVGLFAALDQSAAIRNVGLVGGSIAGGNFNVGALVGQSGGLVERSYSTASVTGSDFVGGLIGNLAFTGTVRESYATGEVFGSGGVGGLVGASNGTVQQSYATGAVNGSGNQVGGLIGVSAGLVEQSFATGAVSGNNTVGGLIGNNSGTIRQSWASGPVDGGNSVGGLVGYSGGGVSPLIEDSYASGEVFGSFSIGGLAGQNDGLIRRTYATGAVRSTSGTAGGLVGRNTAGTIEESWASGRLSGSSVQRGGLVGNNQGTVTTAFYDTDRANAPAGPFGSNSGSATNVFGLTTAEAFVFANYAGFNAANWIQFDGDTRPFLATEYSTTIYNAHQLQLMASNLSANYTIGRSFDASETDGGFNPSGMWSAKGFMLVGTDPSTGGTAFTGSLDGANKTITYLFIDRSTQDNVGLFGFADGASTIQNVGIIGALITGQNNVGTLAGTMFGTVSNSYATVDTCGCGEVNGVSAVGGLLGMSAGNVSGSYADVMVTGTGSSLGGLIGFAAGGAISNSYATGSVFGDLVTSSNVGGLIGASSTVTVDRSFATGLVMGGTAVGGLIGFSSAIVTDSYATGAVIGSTNVGGLIGYNSVDGKVINAYAAGWVEPTCCATTTGALVGVNDGEVTNAYWNTETSGRDRAIGIDNGIVASTTFDRTTAQLQDAGMPAALGSNWGIVADTSFPYLNWRFPNGPTVISGTVVNDPVNNAGLGVGLAIDAALIGTTVSGANGYYQFMVDPKAVDAVALTWLTTERFPTGNSGGTPGTPTYSNAIRALGAVAGSGNGHASGLELAPDRVLVIAGPTLTTMTDVAILMERAHGDIFGGNSLFSYVDPNLIRYFACNCSVDFAPNTSFKLQSTASSFTVDQTIGQIGTEPVNVDIQLTTPGANLVVKEAINALGQVLVRAPGDITLQDNGYIFAQGTGDAIVLSAGGKFINNLDPFALFVDNTVARWLVYSASPATNTFNGLDSDNYAIWGATYDTVAPGSVAGATSNRYLFAETRTLTFTSVNRTKTYGDDATAAVATALAPFDASQLYQNSAVANGAFKIENNLADISTGALSVTSTGSDVTAGVAGSPYVITVAQGSFYANGYSFIFNNAGRLAVTPKTLTVSLTGTVTKTFDGTTAATLTPANYTPLSGMVNGDAVSVAVSSSGTYDTADVGTNKLVTAPIFGLVAGPGIASNYTIASTVSGNVGVINAAPANNNNNNNGNPPSQFGGPNNPPPQNNTTINFQNQQTGPVVLTRLTGLPTGISTAAIGDTFSAPQATNNGFTFRPISMYDAGQYSQSQLPGWQDGASMSAVFAMLSRGVLPNQAPSFLIDTFWNADKSSWLDANGNNPLKDRVTFSDGAGNNVVPGDDTAFKLEPGKPDMAAALANGPVMIGGAIPGREGTHWMLATKMTDDGRGIIANDPITGAQVVLAYDPATKTVGGVTGIFNPKSKGFVALSQANAGTVLSDAGFSANAAGPLAGFAPGSYFAVAIK